MFPVPPESEALLSSLAQAVTAGETCDGKTLDAAVRDSFDKLGHSEMMAITARSDDGADETKVWTKVLGAVEVEAQRRMGEAKVKLEELMEAGEINELDKRIVKLVKAGGIDAAFLTVLNQNLEDARLAAGTDEPEGNDDGEGDAAQSPGAGALFNAFNHVATRVQEELEKRTDPAVALLHKLMRTEDAALRGRILGHYLTPQREILMPDTTSIPLDKPKPSRVAPQEFAQAIVSVVATLRSLDVNGDTVVATIEQVRSVAKEARLVLLNDELSGDGDPANPVVAQFSEAVGPAFPQGSRGAPPSSGSTRAAVPAEA